MAKIAHIHARSVLDSRAHPTVEVQLRLDDETESSASVPSGASTGQFEAVALPIPQAIEHVNKIIGPKLEGMDVEDQKKIDDSMRELDGTEQKSRLGANAILGVSLSCARAAAEVRNIPLYQHIAELAKLDGKLLLPTPMYNIINGGMHAKNNLDFQEFMIVPGSLQTFREKYEAGLRVFQMLKTVLEERRLRTDFGDEGGYAPDLESNEQALEILIETIRTSGFTPGKDVALALDVAASALPKSFSLKPGMFVKLVEKFPIISIEDPLKEEAWHEWAQLKLELEQAGHEQVLIVGDDLFVTNFERLQKGINAYVANAILIKVNQIGTLSETLDVIRLAKQNNYTYIISHRSGETLDTFIADLAVGTGAKFIKTGAPNPSAPERMAKYFRLLEIEKEVT